MNVKLLSPVPPNGLTWPVSQPARWSPTCLFPGPTFSQAPPSSTSSLRWETSKSSLIQCLSSPLPASSQLPTGSCHFSSHCKSRPFLSTHSLGSTRVLLLQTRTPNPCPCPAGLSSPRRCWCWPWASRTAPSRGCLAHCLTLGLLCSIHLPWLPIANRLKVQTL